MAEENSDTTGLSRPRPTQSGSWLLIGVIICGVVALIAIVLAAYAVGKTTENVNENNGVVKTVGLNPNSQSSVSNQYQNKVWTIALGHNWGAHEYVDPQGYLAGFNYDLVEKVCKAAGMRCEMIWEPLTHCWDSQAGKRAQGGSGLLGKWYDACTAWSSTVERSAVMAFSDPFLQLIPAYLNVKKGNPMNFDHTDLRSIQKPIGFMDGYSSDEKCLARLPNVQGSILDPSKIVHFFSIKELKQALTNETIIAAFTSVIDIPIDPSFDRKGPAQNCRLSGNGMMTRKDNDFNTYWNIGFRKIKANGEFQKVCSDANTKHGAKGRVKCLL